MGQPSSLVVQDFVHQQYHFPDEVIFWFISTLIFKTSPRPCPQHLIPKASKNFFFFPESLSFGDNLCRWIRTSKFTLCKSKLPTSWSYHHSWHVVWKTPNSLTTSWSDLTSKMVVDLTAIPPKKGVYCIYIYICSFSYIVAWCMWTRSDGIMSVQDTKQKKKKLLQSSAVLRGSLGHSCVEEGSPDWTIYVLDPVGVNE